MVRKRRKCIVYSETYGFLNTSSVSLKALDMQSKYRDRLEIPRIDPVATLADKNQIEDLPAVRATRCISRWTTADFQKELSEIDSWHVPPGATQTQRFIENESCVGRKTHQIALGTLQSSSHFNDIPVLSTPMVSSHSPAFLTSAPPSRARPAGFPMAAVRAHKSGRSLSEGALSRANSPSIPQEDELTADPLQKRMADSECLLEISGDRNVVDTCDQMCNWKGNACTGRRLRKSSSTSALIAPGLQISPTLKRRMESQVAICRGKYVQCGKYAKLGTLRDAIQSNGWTLANERAPAKDCVLKWASGLEIHREAFGYQQYTKGTYIARGWAETPQLVNHFCRERCVGFSNKQNLLHRLRAFHSESELSQWFPRSYDLTIYHERQKFIADFAQTAAEAVVVRASSYFAITRKENLEDVGHALPHFTPSPSRKTLELALQILRRVQIVRRDTYQLHSHVDTTMLLKLHLVANTPAMSDDCKELCKELWQLQRADSCNDVNEADEVLMKSVHDAIERMRGQTERQTQILNGQNLWLIKKANLDRGKGIAVNSHLPELLDAAERFDYEAVAQKYLERPLALDGRKMDLRIWLLILRWNPMQACLWREPYVRLASKPLNFQPCDLQDPLVHLTNRCQQVKSHGGQHSLQPPMEDEDHCWTLPKLLTWLSGPGGFPADVWDVQVWPRLVALVRRVLDAIESIPHSAPSRTCSVRSFEIIGLDIMLDEDLRPWFLEANCSPDLCANAGPALREVITRSLTTALNLAAQAQNQNNMELPLAREVDAADHGLAFPGGDSWYLVKNNNRHTKSTGNRLVRNPL